MSNLTKQQVKEIIIKVHNRISVKELLDYYGVNYVVDGDECHMHCVDVAHNDRNPSMNFNIDKKVYNCLSCSAKGNWYTFITNAEKKYNNRSLSVSDKLKIGAEISGVTFDSLLHTDKFSEIENEFSYVDVSESEVERQEEVFPDSVLNQFYKKGNTYFISRGYQPETLKHFEMGFGVKGEMKDRCVFPVRNIDGGLLGWSGRSVINNAQVKWFHAPKERFLKGLTLYNIDKAFPYISETGEVYIFESIGNVMRAYEAGIYNAVATLGNKMTKQQAQFICDIADTAIIFSDNDMGGIEMNNIAIELLYGRVDLKFAFYDFGKNDKGKSLDAGDVTPERILNEVSYLYIDEYYDKMGEVFLKMLENTFDRDYSIKLPNGKEILCTNELKDKDVVNKPQLLPYDIIFFQHIDKVFGVDKISLI